MKKLLTIGLVAAAALAGCDSGQDEATADGEASEHRELLEAVQAPLDRAHSVEVISAERRAQLDAELEEAGSR